MSIDKAREVINIEAMALQALSDRLDERLDEAIDLIMSAKGRVIVTGMGKAGLVGRKIASTLSSTGTPATWLNSAEAVHGDLGQVTKDDIVILLSKSGETDETKRLLPIVKKINARMIALTGNMNSSVAKESDVAIDVSVDKEGCPLELAPMASTTTMMAAGDAIAACLILRKGFKREDFAFNHPGGSLGRKLLLQVEDIMRKKGDFPTVDPSEAVKDVLLKITKHRCGSACVMDENGYLAGIFTDGDLRRHLESDPEVVNRKVGEVMTPNPITISASKLAAEAAGIMKKHQFDEIPVLDLNDHLIGLVDIQDLLKAGLV